MFFLFLFICVNCIIKFAIFGNLKLPKASIMKRIIFIVLSFCILTLPLMAQWEQLNGPRSGQEEGIIYSNDTIFKGGTNNFFYSVNQGQNWVTLCPAISEIQDNDYIVTRLIKHDNIFLASIYGKSIFKSSDYGLTWQSSNNGLDAYNEAVCALALYDNVVLAGSPGGLHYSLDYGDSWNIANGYTEYDIVDGFTKFQDSILTITDRGKVFISKFGVDWDLKYDFNCNTAFCNIYSNDSYIFAIVDTSHIFRSNDYGNNWTELNLPQNDLILTSLSCNGNNIVIGTMHDGVLVSSDNGLSWEYRNTGLTKAYNRVHFLDDLLLTVSRDGIFVYEENKWVSRNDNQQYTLCDEIIVVHDTIIACKEHWNTQFSSDEGENWESINNGVYYGNGNHGEIYDILKIYDKLFRVTEYGGVLFSSDNGQNWESRNNGLDCSRVTQIEFNGEYVYIVTDECGMYRSNDFGLNWTNCCPEIPLNGFQSNTFELTETNGIISLIFGQEFYTIDGGETWTQIDPPINFSDAYIKDSVIIVGGQYSNTLISTDNFQTWGLYNDGLPQLMPEYPNLDVSQVATDGTNFFIGTFHHGIYALIENVWTPVNYGLDFSTENNSTFEICISNGNIYITIGDYGIWKRNISKIVQRPLTGIVYNDLNENGLKDMDELGIPNAILNTVNTNGFYSSDSSGNYTAYFDCPTDTLKVFNQCIYYESTPYSYTVSASVDSLDFGIIYNQNINDLRISNTSYSPPSPGFEHYLMITYLNVGTTSMSGSVKLEFDNEIEYISSDPIADVVTDSTLEWYFNDFNMMQSENIQIEFNIPPTIEMGDNLEFVSTIYPLVNDETPNNNIDVLSEVTLASFDPNDKSVRPEGNIPFSFVENQEEFIYTVRFQNTGTAPAINISILDTLSPNLFIPSFRVLSSSHDYDYSISGPGIVEFSFEDIMLPDSNTNEPLSHGFIKYSVKPLRSLVIGDEICNTAHIYFDFNEAVVTNTTSNIVSIIQQVNSEKSGFTYSLYPNPVGGILNIETDCSGMKNIRIVDSQGRIVKTKNMHTTSLQLDCNDLLPGLYFVLIGDESDNIKFKFVKQ
jgi:uncharacterized repeat protein (TIGR01451 family)